MPASKTPSPLAELRRYLKQHPDTETIELLIADVNGLLRGKQIQRHEFEKCFTDGFAMPGGTVLLDTLGDVVEGIGWSNEDGDPDLPAEIVPGRLVPVPWAARPTAQTMFRFRDVDGRPFAADPRTVLEQAVGKLARRCPRIFMAAELEFFLLEADSDRPTPRTARVPGIGRPQPGPQVYTPDELWEIEAEDPEDRRIPRRQARIARWLTQVATVRSDVFAVYVVVRGYQSGDFSTTPVEQMRFVAILDRSRITDADGRVRILGFLEF